MAAKLAGFDELDEDDDTLTDDQKQARKEAGDKARADGKKGKNLQAAVDTAVAHLAGAMGRPSPSATTSVGP